MTGKTKLSEAQRRLLSEAASRRGGLHAETIYGAEWRSVGVLVKRGLLEARPAEMMDVDYHITPAGRAALQEKE